MNAKILSFFGLGIPKWSNLKLLAFVIKPNRFLDNEMFLITGNLSLSIMLFCLFYFIS